MFKNDKARQLVKILAIVCIAVASIAGIFSALVAWTNKELDKCFDTLFDNMDYM